LSSSKETKMNKKSI